MSSSVNHHLLPPPQLFLNLFPAARRRQRNGFTWRRTRGQVEGGDVSAATLSLLVVIILFISLR